MTALLVTIPQFQEVFIMVRYLKAPSCTLVALSIVLVAVSASEAGLFGRWRSNYTYYYYPAYQPAVVSVPPAASQPAATAQPATQRAQATKVPTVYTAAKPVIAETPAPAAVAVPQASYAPASGSYSGGWSVTPRTSWDYGTFPPYNR